MLGIQRTSYLWILNTLMESAAVGFLFVAWRVSILFPSLFISSHDATKQATVADLGIFGVVAVVTVDNVVDHGGRVVRGCS